MRLAQVLWQPLFRACFAFSLCVLTSCHPTAARWMLRGLRCCSGEERRGTPIALILCYLAVLVGCQYTAAIRHVYSTGWMKEYKASYSARIQVMDGNFYILPVGWRLMGLTDMTIAPAQSSACRYYTVHPHFFFFFWFELVMLSLVYMVSSFFSQNLYWIWTTFL